MRQFRLSLVGIFVLISIVFSLTPVLSPPIYAAAKYNIDPVPQPPAESVCTEDITAAVAWMNKFTLIVLDDVNNPAFTHVHGAAYVGGNFNSTQGHVFGQNASLTCSDPALVVGGTVNSTPGAGQLQINTGSARFKNAVPTSRLIMNSGCAATQDTTLSDAQITSDLVSASAYMANATPNNTLLTKDAGGSLIFHVDNVTANGLAIFNVSAGEVFGTTGLNPNNMIQIEYGAGIDPNNTTVLINLSGASLNWTNNASFGSAFQSHANRIIWNIYNATTISLPKQWYGAILAPNATLNAGSQNLTGSIAVKTFESSGEIHDPNFLLANTTPLTDLCPAAQNPGIHIKKYTNGEDADTPTGPYITAGDEVLWTYIVTNTGNVVLSNVVVTDNMGVSVYLASGDTNGDNLLDLDETWTYTATGTAVAGQYANIGYVKGESPQNKTVTDDDPSHYYGVTPGIFIKKYTNGEDADAPTGPYIPVGGDVEWTYVVTNTGNVALSNIVITDNMGVELFPVGGDTNDDQQLDVDETWTYTATGTAVAGQYANIGYTTGMSPDGKVVKDDDPSHYFGATPGIVIKKYTNGKDADAPTGPYIAVGDDVLWTYIVTNTGNVTLTNVQVTDNIAGVSPVYASGDNSNPGVLDVGEAWTFSAMGTAIAGQYANIGTVTADTPTGTPVTDDDPSHYFGSNPGVHIEKHTNGEDADEPTGPSITVGDPVVWEYFVTNTGNVPLSDIEVTDNVQGVNPVYVSGDTNNNTLLDLDETWTFSASGTAIAGQYSNIGTVTGKSPTQATVTDDDPSHYFGTTPEPALAALGDWVWYDTNANGTQDAGETGVPGVQVTLYTCSNVAVGDPLRTNDQGQYLFTNLVPGCYYVVFSEIPAGYSLTTANQDGVDDALDSDAEASTGQTPQVTLQSDDRNLTLDAGLVARSLTVTATPQCSHDAPYLQYRVTPVNFTAGENTLTIRWRDMTSNAVLYEASGQPLSNTVLWPQAGLDEHGNGNQWPGWSFVEGRWVDNGSPLRPQVRVEFALTATQVVTVAYPNPDRVCSPGPRAALGNRVWLDDAEQNGRQDAGELNVEGVKVTLYTCDDEPVGDPLFTDVNGEYLFRNLVAGCYYVVFDPATLPQDFTFTQSNAVGVDDTLDSDADPATGQTPSVTLQYGQDYRDLDAGVVPPGLPPTNAPDGEQPHQRQFIFLPSVQGGS